MFVESVPVTEEPVVTPKSKPVRRRVELEIPAPTAETVKVLTRARELIAKAWCRQNQMEKRRNRFGIGGYAYCSLGGIWEAAGELGHPGFGSRESMAAQWALARAARIGSPSLIPHWNDHRSTKAGVLEAFDLAIANVKAEL